MSETTESKPKKSVFNAKNFFWAVGILFALWGIDHYTFNWVSGGAEVTLTDSTIVVAPSVDTTVKPVAVDTTKK